MFSVDIRIIMYYFTCKMINNEIVLKALDEITSQVYEKTLVDTDIHEIMEKTQFYFFLEDCIRNNAKLNLITTSKDVDKLTVTFSKSFTYFKITKSIVLNLITNYVSELIEKNYKIEQLEKQLDFHKNITVSFEKGKYITFKRDTDTINLSKFENSNVMWRELQYFPNLTKLVINDTIKYCTNDTKTLSEIYQVRQTYTRVDGNGNEILIKVNLPSVTSLQIIHTSSNNRTKLNELVGMPNLKELVLINYTNELIDISIIKEIKSLQVIKLFNCKGIKNCEDITNYCKESSIELEL